MTDVSATTAQNTNLSAASARRRFLRRTKKELTMEMAERLMILLNVNLGIALVVLSLLYLREKIKDDDGDK